MVNKNIIDVGLSNERKNMPTFSILKKPTRANYLTPGAKKSSNILQNAFIETPVFYYFDSKYYIHIKTDA